MNRFFLSPANIKDQVVHFPGDIARQIRHVLRLGPGDVVEVLDNSGQVYRVRLELDPDGSQVTGRVQDSYEAETEPGYPLILYFGLTGREKVEWILQKGTEIGITTFQPFISSRTLVQSPEVSPKKQDRWERIIREAAEQSHRGRLPELKAPSAFTDCVLVAQEANGLNLLAWEAADPATQPMPQALKSYSGGAIGLFVGPEGGFSTAEVDLARSNGCQVVSLGSRILRMETAALVFPALVLYGLGAL